MIELIEKSPVPAQKHREYMKGARMISADIVLQRIKRSNPRLYAQMGVYGPTGPKFGWNSRTGTFGPVERNALAVCHATPDYYIVDAKGTTWYLRRNGL